MSQRRCTETLLAGMRCSMVTLAVVLALVLAPQLIKAANVPGILNQDDYDIQAAAGAVESDEPVRACQV